MKTILKCSTFVALVIAFVGWRIPAGFAQDETPTSKAVEQMEQALDAKDDAAVSQGVAGLIDAYLAQGTTDDEKKKIVDSLGKALRFAGKDGKVAIQAAQGLGGMGEDAAKVLSAALNDKRFRKDEVYKEAYLAIIRALGTTKSEREAKTLMDLLKDKDNYVIAAAAEGLGNYTDVKQTTRKRVAEALIKTLDSAFNAAEADPRNTTLQKKYEVIGGPLFTSLQKVTGASVGSAPEWRKWFNDNKKKNWD